MVVTEPEADEAQFDQRHLIELYKRGLINELPYELGPMPVVDTSPAVAADLSRWNIVDSSTGALTPAAAETLAGLVNYEWAVWGIVLLYNERQAIVSDLPSEFVQYGVHFAQRAVPRVTFLIGMREQTLTTATLAAGRMVITSDLVRGGEQQAYADTAAIVSAILDPQQVWNPYPMQELAIPAATADALKGDRREEFADDDKFVDAVDATSTGLKEAKLATPTVRALVELLERDNVAVAQLCLTRRTPLGKRTARNNAAGVLFFAGDKDGVVVSYPTRAIDGRPWITYEPATAASMTRAIAALHTGLENATEDDVTIA